MQVCRSVGLYVCLPVCLSVIRGSNTKNISLWGSSLQKAGKHALTTYPHEIPQFTHEITEQIQGLPWRRQRSSTRH